MGGVADRPEENKNNNDDDRNKDNKKALYSSSSAISELSIEKQFTHMMFCQQIQNIDLEAAKQLLVELHMLYLRQQNFLIKFVKQDIY